MICSIPNHDIRGSHAEGASLCYMHMHTAQRVWAGRRQSLGSIQQKVQPPHIWQARGGGEAQRCEGSIIRIDDFICTRSPEGEFQEGDTDLVRTAVPALLLRVVRYDYMIKGIRCKLHALQTMEKAGERLTDAAAPARQLRGRDAVEVAGCDVGTCIMAAATGQSVSWRSEGPDRVS